MKTILILCSVLLMNCTTAKQTAKVEGTTSTESLENEMLKAVNDLRTKGCNCGGTYMPPVKKLVWNNKLESAAQSHSNYMKSSKKFSHTGKNGSNPGSRITAAGYKWMFYAENIAMGQRNVKEVMQSWITSSGHCKNIMNAKAKEMGAAKSGEYWTQVFGAQ